MYINQIYIESVDYFHKQLADERMKLSVCQNSSNLIKVDVALSMGELALKPPFVGKKW